MAPYAMVNKPIPSNPKTVRANTRWETLYETAVIFVKLVPPNVTCWLANPSEFYLSFHLNVVPLKSE
jgi:hypothetical protein